MHEQPDTQALQTEIIRLDGIAGVVLQTGFAASVGAFAIIVTVRLVPGVETVLALASMMSALATVIAAVSLAQRPSFNDLVIDEQKLITTYTKKKARCAAALIILSTTIEVATLIIALAP